VPAFAQRFASAGAERVRSIRSMRTTEEIVESIDNRLRELNEEIKTLDAARVALDAREDRASRRPPARAAKRDRPRSGASSGTKASAQSRRVPSAEASVPSPRGSRERARPTSRTGRSRAPKAVPADRLESLLSGNGGLTTSALAEQTGENRDRVLGLLRELETAGRVRRVGQRRGTRWHAITDEDRIRERAAELEALQKRSA
jgi:hypothetical protein